MSRAASSGRNGGADIGSFLIWGVVIWVHVIAAVTWAGGMIFVTVVLMPGLRGLPGHLRASVLQRIGPGIKAAGWISILVLLMTGVLNVIHLQVQWNTFVGHLLAAKLSVLAAVLVLSALHDFVLGPRLMKQMEADSSDPSLGAGRKTLSWVARINLGLVLIVIFLAVLIARS
ncbi:MAG TPA: DUF4149 domain-containing protein [Nitrospiria bacterium]